jgi:hypothetical protein
MEATRFEGSGPVARYWLSRCEGFSVAGDARGVVVELIRDADPAVTTRLVVRRGLRSRIISATAVASVDPAERVLLVKRRRATRPPRERRKAVAERTRRTSGKARAAIAAAVAAATPSVQAAWSTTTRSGSHAAGQARRVLAPALAGVLGSFSLLVRDALSTGRMLRANASNVGVRRR